MLRMALGLQEHEPDVEEAEGRLVLTYRGDHATALVGLVLVAFAVGLALVAEPAMGYVGGAAFGLTGVACVMAGLYGRRAVFDRASGLMTVETVVGSWRRTVSRPLAAITEVELSEPVRLDEEELEPGAFRLYPIRRSLTIHTRDGERFWLGEHREAVAQALVGKIWEIRKP